MPELTAITRETHADKSWKKFQSYGFASKDNLAPLAGAEIARAVSSLPLAFIKHQDRYVLVALLSFTPKTNLFVAPDGRWLGEYVPACFRGHPFALARARGQDKPVLCVDETTGMVLDDKTAGEPFFDDTGALAPSVKEILDFLTRVARNRAATEAGVAALATAGVISEWPLTLTAKKQEQPVKGLYRIDEERLNRLPDDRFLDLRKTLALPVAYGQLLSMGNIRKFENLAQIRKKQAAQKGPDITGVLGNDDIISFD